MSYKDYKTLNTSKRLKILLVGDMETGKTSILERYVDNNFNDIVKATIAFDFKIKAISYFPKNICLHLWDISGSSKYSWFVDKYVKQMDVILLVCNAKNKKSIYNVAYYWYDIIKKSININNKFVFYVVVNKSDCFGEDKKKITCEIDELFSKYKDIRKVFYVSAKTNNGITKMFSQIIDDIMKPKKIPEKVSKNILIPLSPHYSKAIQCVLI